MNIIYDIIIVGGGHSGIEAILSSYKLGANSLLITMNINSIGKMSCNPSIGGIGKGQIVREIDALGGYMGKLADKSMIQFRMLNKSKGPAMWSPRAQIDRKLYIKNVLKIFKKKKINILEDIVIKLIIKNNNILGVITKKNNKIFSKTVILTNGTFLNGKICIGNKYYNGGRINENSSIGISEQLKKHGIIYNKMKTGTSPRILKNTINFKKLLIQKGDKNNNNFSFFKKKILKKQKKCYITFTNNKTHNIIIKNIHKSPIINGIINNNGPRYCPSIEDKVLKFKNKNKHQIFIEPDGWNSNIIYINGFSTSLPKKIQYKSIKTIKGLENVKIIQYGYAVEYDYFNPIQLKLTLETKKINNLFFAGQINGTTGYEEAACQGLIAGINAYLKIKHKKPFILKRNESYIGVLIDDLVNKGTKEPYRIFTSRAEYRILLRQDNADIRLTKKGYKLGLIKKKFFKKVIKKKIIIKKIIKFLKNKNIIFNNKNININNLLLRPQITIDYILKYLILKKNKFINKYIKYILKYKYIISNYIKYEYYIKKEKKNVKLMKKLENLKIPKHFNYFKINSLSKEAQEKLNYFRPLSIGQASRISGITPSDINILIIYIK
ncbi:tRNA uridine-5-carboxymethylaminomethyl(34) synthesis enzyme MnmG [Candidatus Shikimatogenerans bostrichidophilus]|uniref:tRNA uridine-5-carboxymethylaminomethyl(34) synthesis enzyme MnmG n=1 Tax=Candidatus Shikimatogenerans bostrichidophilus TaxID=2943807 RepID=UPI0029666923